MTWIAGADGCRKGWFRVSLELATFAVRFDLVETARDLLARVPRPTVLGIDIPIGLSDAGPRECDRLARKLLGRPRASSVFPAPIRPALAASSRLEASAVTKAADGRGIAAQAWGIYAKVREVDEWMRADADAREIVHEVHPEVSFAAWSGTGPIAASKKSAEGRAIRLALAEAWLGPGVLDRARGDHLKKDLADDDILDAIATLWTAARIASGNAVPLPADPPTDAAGLPMRIVY